MTPDQLEQFLTDLATKLGPAGQHVYELAVRQQLINGILGTFVWGATFVVCLVILWRCHHAYVGMSQEDKAHDPGMMAVVFSFFSLLFGTIALIAWALLVLPLLLNPEWYAIQSLIATAKP